MRVVIAVVISFVCVYVAADDKKTCERRCEVKFQNDDVKNACLYGCSNRGSVASGGPLSFVTCHRVCDTKYTNTTDNEKDACHFACSLPMHSSVVMTLVNENGKSRWKVVRQDGDDEPVTTMEDESPLGNLLGRSNDNILALRAPSSSSEESLDSWEQDDLHNFEKFHEKMERIVDKMRKQFVEAIRNSMDENGNVIRQRPVGHSPWGQADVQVGNENEDGQPIIISRPLKTGEGDQNGILLEFRHRETRSRLMVLFHWLLIITGIVALLTTIFAICLFLRSFRTKNYRRMGRDGVSTMPVFARVQPVSPLPVKKVPEEGWIENSLPMGTAPPAYDQVSIHALTKVADSDKSTDEAETPSPIH